MSAPAQPSRRRCTSQVFGLLTVLTVAEIGVVYVPGIARGLLIAALVLLAVAKAALVLLYFMHLRGETPGAEADRAGPVPAARRCSPRC